MKIEIDSNITQIKNKKLLYKKLISSSGRHRNLSDVCIYYKTDCSRLLNNK